MGTRTMISKHIAVYFILVFVGGLFAGGCAVNPEVKSMGESKQSDPVQIDKEVFQHILSISPEGNDTDDSTAVREAAYSGAENELMPDQVNQILKGIQEYDQCREEEPTKIVLFIHGGLVEEEVIAQRVQSVYKQILPHAYPIFVNWRSGLFDSYAYQIAKVRNGELSNSAKFSWPVFLLTDIADYFVHAPKSWIISGTHAIKGGVLRKREAINKSLSSYDDAYDSVRFTGNGSYSNNFVNSLQWWLAGPIKAFTTPAVHVIGKPAWDEMLRRADNVVYPTNFNSIDEAADIDKPTRLSALGELLKKLQEYQSGSERNDSTSKHDFEIDIVGHSMGAIIVNRLLSQQSEFKFNNIVHMASADTVGALFADIVPYLRNNEDARFFSLHLHPRNEERETNAFGLAPTGSLLIYIEDMYTTPDSVMTRRSGAWDNIARVFDRLPKDNEISDRLNFTVFGLDKLAFNKNKIDQASRVDHPQKHGDFSRTRFWLESTWLGSLSNGEETEINSSECG